MLRLAGINLAEEAYKNVLKKDKNNVDALTTAWICLAFRQR